jgi:hypothetical protein
MRLALGTYAWTEAYAGKMNERDKLRIIGMFARLQVQEIWERSPLRRSWLTQRRLRLDIETVHVPDTPMVREAETYVASFYSDPLLKHCYRCYYWGCLLAQFDQLQLDTELFLVATLFHDLGLTDKFLPQARSSCFTRAGGRLAAQFVQARGGDDHAARKVYEAISLHLNPYIALHRYGAEETLVGAAAQVDLLG